MLVADGQGSLEMKYNILWLLLLLDAVPSFLCPQPFLSLPFPSSSSSSSSIRCRLSFSSFSHPSLLQFRCRSSVVYVTLYCTALRLRSLLLSPPPRPSLSRPELTQVALLSTPCFINHQFRYLRLVPLVGPTRSLVLFLWVVCAGHAVLAGPMALWG
jgi:hypothetical protein